MPFSNKGSPRTTNPVQMSEAAADKDETLRPDFLIVDTQQREN